MGLLDALRLLLAQQEPPNQQRSAAPSAQPDVAPVRPPSLKTSSPAVAKLPKIGTSEAVCPHCGAVLEKMPGRKRKCAECGEFIYVRTRPQDRIRVLVTESQAQEIDDQWDVHHGYQSLSKYDESGLSPDEQWGQCNKELLEHARTGKWGLYRNTRLHMANIVHREGRLQQALQTYLEVCYLDLNGPCNVGGLQEYPDILREYPPFRPEEALLAPGVLAWVREVSQSMDLDDHGLKSEYLEVANRVHAALHLPVSPDEAWPSLLRALSDA